MINTILERCNKGMYQKLLDIGCGNYGWNHYCFNFLEKVQFKVGLDANIDRLRTYKGTDWVVLYYDLNEKLPFLDKTFDICVCLDVIEHLPKDTAIDLILQMQMIGKDVVIYTPEGFFDTLLHQKEYVYSDLDVHKCGFTAEELRDLGFHVDRVGPIFKNKDVCFYGMYGYYIK